MTRWLAAFVLVSAGASWTFSQQASTDITPGVTYKDLATKPDDYLHKLVRFRGTYGYGFEWTFLCDSFCRLTPVRISVDFGDLCPGSNKKLERGTDNFGNRAEVVFVGRLENGVGADPYRFVISCVEEFKRLPLPISMPRKN